MMTASRSSQNTEYLAKTSSRPAIFYILLVILFFSLAPAEAYQASAVPWSGYWWPFTSGGLGTGQDYRGRPAPLEKYYLLTTGISTGQALTEYMNEFYDPNAPDWYGLCAHWARAACFEPVDILPSSEDNLFFRVGDKKGLLTLAHDSDIVAMADGSQPEEFHFWLLNYIRDQGKAFVADLDAGEEVWSFPIYRYDMQTSRSGNVESVSVRVYYADDSVPPDYVGTKVRTSDYTYGLLLDGGGAITGGQWTGKSVSIHPQLVRCPLDVGAGYPGLDYQEVVRLAGSRDDFLERGNRSVEISPGTYNLILLDEDVYTISASSGDVLSLQIAKQAGSALNIEAVVTDGNGLEVRREIVDKDNPLGLFTAVTSPYTIRLTQDDYTSDPNFYTITVDLSKTFNQEVPYIPKSGDWSGFALTNPGSAAVSGVTLTTRDEGGAPLQTVLGPLTIAPGEKRLFFFDELPVRLHELGTTERLTLAADGPVDLLNLIGDDNLFLTTLIQGEARSGRLVIPDTAAAMTPGTRMLGGVRNESFEESRVTLSLYSADGLLQNEVIETIPARGYLSLKPGEYPFYTMPSSGWIEVQASGEQLLSGFHYLENPSGVESLFALPADSAGKIVPHIARPGYWITKVTLINPNYQENPVRLHPALAGADTDGDYDITLAPREKRVVELQTLFGRPAGDPLYHSILEITGLYPLAGYYTYAVPGGRDYASYPLLDETSFKNVLCLPHYAGNNGGFWWTGVVVCNPLTIAQTVRIEPYDYDGNLMEDDVQSLNLNAGAYDVFDVRARFGESAAAISFINFRTGSDSGVIGGFYLYGNHRNKNILGGANM